MAPENNNNMRIIGTCDRCEKKIFNQKGEEFVMLKASHYKYEVKTYHTETLLCKECSDHFFNRWIAGKGG